MQTTPTCAVVTGAASGIGRAIAKKLALRGASLVLADIDSSALQAAARQIAELAPGVRIVPVASDLCQPGQVAALADTAFGAFGRVDWLFHCAGMLATGRSWELDEAQWSRVMDINLTSAVRAARAFVPRMIQQGSGHIINIASLAGMLPSPWLAPYTVSKHGLVAYSETLQLEFEALGLPLHVSVVLPGPVDTGICRHMTAQESDARVTATNEFLRGMIAEGMAPDALADIVLAGVDAGKFWIFPHADILKPALRMRADMLQAVAA